MTTPGKLAAMGRVRRASALGLATAVIGILFSLVPLFSSLEDTVGLRVLFGLRGPLPSPPGVVIVSIDESAAAHLNLPPAVRDWPRSYHARLIDRLVDQGASVIAFDLQFFADGSAAGDAELASAIERSKRVVLVQLLEPIRGSPHEIWRQQDPLPSFLAGAAGLAPVPIPDTPLVTWFWTFLRAGADEVPTLPAVVLQVGASRALATLIDELRSAGVVIPEPPTGNARELLAYMRNVRSRLRDNPPAVVRALVHLAMRKRLDDRERQLVRALARLYTRDAASYLNFYGPSGTICTVPYELLHQGSASPCPLEGATVFVGVGRSRLHRAEQIDTYHTIYEQSDGVDLSGVELQATAFANLMTGTPLRPLSPTASLVFLIATGFAFGASIYWARTRRKYVRGRLSARVEAAAAATVLAAAFCLVAYALFAYAHVIIPVAIPLAVQFPTALILGLLIRPVVHREQVEAVCLAADAGGSTAVGQRLPHGPYAELMTEYNRTLANCVTSRDGLALPPHGDGFVSLWFRGPTSADDAALRLAACQAALEMCAAAADVRSRRGPR